MTRAERTDRAALIAERDELSSALNAARIENEELTNLVIRLAALLDAIDRETPESNVTDYLVNAERVKEALASSGSEIKPAAGPIVRQSERGTDSDGHR